MIKENSSGHKVKLAVFYMKQNRNEWKYWKVNDQEVASLYVYVKFYFFSLLYIRMSGKNINFDNQKIKKSNFYKNKKITQIDDTDLNEILVSKERTIRYKEFN